MTVHTEQRWSAETETIAAVALEDVQPPDGSVPDEAFFADARRVLAALADSGRLLPDGGETREQWGVHSIVHDTSPRDGVFRYPTEAQADEALAYRRNEAPDHLRDPDAVKVHRTITETRWEPVHVDT